MKSSIKSFISLLLRLNCCLGLHQNGLPPLLGISYILSIVYIRKLNQFSPIIYEKLAAEESLVSITIQMRFAKRKFEDELSKSQELESGGQFSPTQIIPPYKQHVLQELSQDSTKLVAELVSRVMRWLCVRAMVATLVISLVLLGLFAEPCIGTNASQHLQYLAHGHFMKIVLRTCAVCSQLRARCGRVVVMQAQEKASSLISHIVSVSFTIIFFTYFGSYLYILLYIYLTQLYH